MPSSQGKSRRHTHKKKAPDRRSSPGYMAVGICQTCGKQCYTSRDDAKRSARVNHPGQVMHIYSCEERPGIFWWHLSSIPADKLKQLRERRAR